jgi:thiamine kinase-like enzyme
MNENGENIKFLASELIEEAGFTSHIKNITPIHQGGNNQLYHIKHIDQEFILKKYFKDSGDLRNRLETEYSFLKLAQERSPKYVPKTYARNVAKSVAIFEFIHGTKLKSSEEIDSFHISQAAKFICDLNINSSNVNFSNASEACFSIDEHLNLIDERIKELNKSLINNGKFKEIVNLLQSTWLKVKNNTNILCKKNSILTSEVLEKNYRILSPSDFGFHNAIIKNDGGVVFIDFEYAGWDDPGKLVGDFFNQVAIPIDSKFQNQFLTESLNFNDMRPKDQGRICALNNVYRIKWCCIILNIFIRKNLERRLFSNPNLNVELLKTTQLNKSKLLLESINNDLH